VRTQLVPTLQQGDIVILDNLPANKSPAAEQAIRDRGACLMFLPSYTPTSIRSKWPFAKFKAHLRASHAHHRRILEGHRPNLRSLHPRMRKLLRVNRPLCQRFSTPQFKNVARGLRPRLSLLSLP
jgi:transposase